MKITLPSAKSMAILFSFLIVCDFGISWVGGFGLAIPYWAKYFFYGNFPGLFTIFLVLLSFYLIPKLELLQPQNRIGNFGMIALLFYVPILDYLLSWGDLGGLLVNPIFFMHPYYTNGLLLFLCFLVCSCSSTKVKSSDAGTPEAEL